MLITWANTILIITHTVNTHTVINLQSFPDSTGDISVYIVNNENVYLHATTSIHLFEC